MRRWYLSRLCLPRRICPGGAALLVDVRCDSVPPPSRRLGCVGSAHVGSAHAGSARVGSARVGSAHAGSRADLRGRPSTGEVSMTRDGHRQLASGVDPGQTVTAVAAGVRKTDSYGDPASAERDSGGRGLARLVIGDLTGAAELLEPLGFTLTTDVDPATGRRYAMAVSETGRATTRRWGLYLVDLGAPPGLCIAVPHPKFDAGCEQLALRLWRATPGSILAMASVHRFADTEPGTTTADHAHSAETLFHQLWTTVLGPRGLPQVQLHGFADDRAPERIAVSTGAGPVSVAATLIADAVAAVERSTTRSWDNSADPGLRATTNVQGIAADANDWIWVHIEHNRTVRDDPARWEPAMDAVASARPGLAAFDRPSPGGPGHEPEPIGEIGQTGSSRYLAREDHVHAGAPAGHAHAHTHTQPAVRFPVVVLPDAVPPDVTITPDAALGDYHRVAIVGDRLLVGPVNGTDGQRLVVEVLAVDGDRRLEFDPAIVLCSGLGPAIATPAVTITARKHWFGTLVCVRDADWFLVDAALQP
jgi:hypothetical protein